MSMVQSPAKTGVQTMTDYEEQFADMPDEVGTGEAAKILDVAGTTGVHWVLYNWLPEHGDAPAVETKKIQFGKRELNRYKKHELIALRRYRDSLDN